MTHKLIETALLEQLVEALEDARTNDDGEAKWDRHSKALTAGRAAIDGAQRVGWQPIETAPKDKSVLLLFPSWGCIRGTWEENKYAKNRKPYWTCDRDSWLGIRAVRDNQPTHWMPLPAAPKEQP